nr:ribonuclease H-like domain-containing protein [Tanacetum cinerariifolium]
MILNTLDQLEKFDAKWDESYFVRYSMSSKAFRVFNKRTKKVEENLHADFLENKPTEKEAGPNWLFDIDTLTNSINYVPVVIAGTSSTNISGTKDAASQDACNADAPESSGISNPTTTSKSPPAEQIESLTVESVIPTISSPVLTACLDNSSETSSDTRLISKGVTSQEETPSLDNILTLSNQFEDILGDTTNTVDTNGVEADLSSMESIIPASPTSTFRIHKDHPKSQIIGPVDTPEEPTKIFDALKDPCWVEAMQEELLQFKIQNVWVLVDCPKGPPGFQDPEFPDRVYKVEKAMYGLHQAPRA